MKRWYVLHDIKHVWTKKPLWKRTKLPTIINWNSDVSIGKIYSYHILLMSKLLTVNKNVKVNCRLTAMKTFLTTLIRNLNMNLLKKVTRLLKVAEAKIARASHKPVASVWAKDQGGKLWRWWKKLPKFFLIFAEVRVIRWGADAMTWAPPNCSS